jgi:quercetin dioxygenase-like cupin family protein
VPKADILHRGKNVVIQSPHRRFAPVEIVFRTSVADVASENGKAIPHRAWFFEESARLPPSLNMRRIPMRSIPVRWSLLGVVLIAIVVYGGTGLVRAVRASDAGHDHAVFSAQLPNVPGKTLTAIVVEYGPGGSSPAHRHAGSVFAYVLSGQIRSETSATGPVRVYRAGETFFEPPAALTWLVQMRVTRSLSLLAVFVADDHAQLTQPAH